MKAILLLGVLLSLMSCGNQSLDTPKAETLTPDGVEVLYFHGKKRCITCNAIENLTREVLETHFAEALKKGEITYRVIDISLPENKEIAQQFEISWASLLICRREKGVLSSQNLTELGFAKAKNRPEEFKSEFIQEVRKFLP